MVTVGVAVAAVGTPFVSSDFSRSFVSDSHGRVVYLVVVAAVAALVVAVAKSHR